MAIRNAFQNASNASANQQNFNKSLARWMISSGIPLYKLKLKSTKNFIETHTKFKCPDESTLRKGYLKPVFEETLENIRNEIGDNAIYLIADETTDVLGRYVINIMAGVLDGKPSKSMLVCTVQLHSGTGEVISQTIMDAMHVIYPDGVKYDNVRLFLTDQG